MNKEELLSALQRIHQDLSAADQIDPEAEQLLRAVTDDIQRLLDDRQESPPEESSQSLAAKLGALVETWEQDHPQIARMIGQAAEALASFGI